ncbi:MAG: hypothetical protein ACE5PM_00150 [Candidatus Hydrothermarchaeales archaeon]
MSQKSQKAALGITIFVIVFVCGGILLSALLKSVKLGFLLTFLTAVLLGGYYMREG